MKLVLLGTGGYFPTSRRQTACLMLPEIGVVLDAGTGMCSIGKHLQTQHLDIFLTHAHLDHVAGLTYLVNLVPRDVLARTTVHAQQLKLNAIREHLFAEAIFPVAPPFKFAPLVGKCPLPDGGTLEHFPLPHPGGSVGFRLDWLGHSLAYITDTTAATDAHYVRRIRGVDVLIHEAYFANDKNNIAASTGHSSLLAVAEVAAAAKVGRLVIAHIDPQVESDDAFNLMAARQIFSNLAIGTDGMEIEL
ncbi:MAG TPA: MBL fold metallo-hydrolase [Lacipirellulaceae bacterium]|nr:MBL fold metallo-hydrolase [Lacipirellulaceae bacterium]